MHRLPLLTLLALAACGDKPDPADDTAVDDTAVDADDTASDDTASDDTAVDDTDPGPVDADGDGHTDDLDCDDADATVYPGAPERCDGVDRDCDGAAPPEADGVWNDHEGVRTELTLPWAIGGLDGAVSLDLLPGTTHVCGGTWYVHLSAPQDARLVGHGETAPVLHGAGTGSVISVTAPGVTLAVDGLTLTDGGGSEGSFGPSGGVIYCAGAGSSVSLEDTSVQNGRATLGGGVYLHNCGLSALRTTIRGGSASYGGGVHAFVQGSGVALSFTDSVIEGNAATFAGGGLNLETYAASTLDLVGARVSGNTGERGAGIWLGGEVAATCAPSADNAAAIVGNVATAYGAGVAVDLSTLDATGCDLGEASTASDNLPADVTVVGYGEPNVDFAFGADASFRCDRDGCAADGG